MTVKLFILCAILLRLHSAHSVTTLTKITDDDFLKMTKMNGYIIILFTKENCQPCEAMEDELLSVHGELEEALDVTIAKIYKSNLVHVYSPNKEPALVFFRHGVPLLYHGEINDELILHTFFENRDPAVKELTDDNFEHLTQATTGSTTGDWFIMFYGKTCSTSRGMTARWEAVGAALRTKLNVARINIEGPGFRMSKRFGISKTPTFVLLHHGHMYTYKSEKLDVDSLLSFAKNFKQMKSAKIPMPSSSMDFLLKSVTDFVEGNDWFVETGLFGMIMGLIGAIFVKCMDRRQMKVQVEEDEDEDEDEEDDEEEEDDEDKDDEDEVEEVDEVDELEFEEEDDEDEEVERESEHEKEKDN